MLGCQLSEQMKGIVNIITIKTTFTRLNFIKHYIHRPLE